MLFIAFLKTRRLRRIPSWLIEYNNLLINSFSPFAEVDASVPNYVLKRVGTEGKRNRGGIEMKY
jgi:hypothetical protein